MVAIAPVPTGTASCMYRPRRRTIRIAVATKTDLVTPEQLGQHLLDIQKLGEETSTEWAEIVPVSAVSGDQVQLLADLQEAEQEAGRAAVVPRGTIRLTTSGSARHPGSWASAACARTAVAPSGSRRRVSWSLTAPARARGRPRR